MGRLPRHVHSALGRGTSRRIATQRKLAQRAQFEHRSVNALATEILSLAATLDPSERRDRLRMRVALGGLGSSDDTYVPGSTSANDRKNAVDAMQGVGPVIDGILGESRRYE